MSDVEWGSPAWCSEQIVRLERQLDMTERQRNQLQRERDELLAALKQLRDDPWLLESQWGIIDAAIRKAEDVTT